MPLLLSLAEPPFFKFVAFALIASGCYFLLYPARAGRPLNVWPRKILGAGIVILGLLLPAITLKEGIVWNEYSPELVEQTRTEKKPSVLYFYADWCAPCLKMDRFTFSDPRVIQEIERFTRIKADVTDMKSARSQALLNQFNVRSVPVLIFRDEAGRELLRHEGFSGPQKMLAILQRQNSKTQN